MHEALRTAPALRRGRELLPAAIVAAVLAAGSVPAQAPGGTGRDTRVAVDLPVTGTAEPGLEAFDEAMLTFMRARGIPAGTLAVMKDGRLVLARGYGHPDRAGKRLLGPETPFRLASLGKPITAAAIRQLIREGKLRLSTRLLDVLPVSPPPGRRRDRRWQNITIGHLLGHEGGWDRDQAFDPMFRSRRIAAALGKRGPATAKDIITYMAGEPLQFDPGSKSVYSNFGYCLLGRVIERVSGRAYVDYVRQEILAPLGVRSMALARSLPRDRNSREPFYSDPGSGRNVVEPDSPRPVPAPDGTFFIEAMDAHGGLIALAPDVARFLNAYGVDGRPVAGRKSAGSFFGSLPGTFTLGLRRADGVVLVALFNQRTDPSGLDYFQIREILGKATDGVRHWPAR